MMVPIPVRAGEGTSWPDCWGNVGADGRGENTFPGLGESCLAVRWCRGFVGTRNAIRAVLPCATAANICTEEYQAEAGVVPSSRDAILAKLLQPRGSVSLLLLLRCSALQDFSLASGEGVLLLMQQVMKLFLEKTMHSCMVINTLLSHSYSVPI